MANNERPPAGDRQTKEQQLAAALRANLRRRKAGAAKPAASEPAKKEREEP